jgi:hypothetical protein
MILWILLIPVAFIGSLIVLYFVSGMYRSDKLEDMLDRGEISLVKHVTYLLNENLDIHKIATKEDIK